MTVPTGVPSVPAPFCACGIAASSQAARCGSCPDRGSVNTVNTTPAPAPFGTPAPAPFGTPAPMAVRPAAVTSQLDSTALMTYSRWKKSTGTFGPAGRVIATLLLLVPLPLLAVGASVGFGLIGGGIYVLVVMPWALRDIWKRAAIPLDAPAAPPSNPRF
jgi:hypothetical protein